MFWWQEPIRSSQFVTSLMGSKQEDGNSSTNNSQMQQIQVPDSSCVACTMFYKALRKPEEPTTVQNNQTSQPAASLTSQNSLQNSLSQLLVTQNCQPNNTCAYNGNSGNLHSGNRSPNSLSPSPSLHSLVFTRGSPLRNSKNTAQNHWRKSIVNNGGYVSLTVEEDLFPPELDCTPERQAVADLLQVSLAEDESNYLEIREEIALDKQFHTKLSLSMLIGEKKKENMVNMHLKIQKELNELKFTRINAKDSALSSGKEDKTGGKPQTGRKMSNRANSLDEYSFIGSADAPALQYLKHLEDQKDLSLLDAHKFNMLLQSSLSQRDREVNPIVIPTCDDDSLATNSTDGSHRLDTNINMSSQPNTPFTPGSSRKSSCSTHLSTRRALEDSQEKLFASSNKVMQAKREAEERTRLIIEKLERKIEDLQSNEQRRLNLAPAIATSYLNSSGPHTNRLWTNRKSTKLRHADFNGATSGHYSGGLSNSRCNSNSIAVLPTHTWTPNVLEVSAATGLGGGGGSGSLGGGGVLGSSVAGGVSHSCSNISESYKFHPRTKKLVHHRGDDILMYSNLLTNATCFNIPPYTMPLASSGNSAFYNRSNLVSNSTDRVLKNVEYTSSISSSGIKLSKSYNC
ncbi:uncharacterized protein LOC142350326 [Convolutriloba macropyga]|uniref:uncharacterized protein LOC142350326 n=1 Tax=Convolutriloba macropyga TaxID=536237 RepID=UPI003F528FAE